MISSARVEACAYWSMASLAYFAMEVPPKPKMSMILGTIQERMRANFHCLIKAITKAEKKDAMAKKPMETYICKSNQFGCWYLIRNAITD